MTRSQIRSGTHCGLRLQLLARESNRARVCFVGVCARVARDILCRAARTLRKQHNCIISQAGLRNKLHIAPLSGTVLTPPQRQRRHHIHTSAISHLPSTPPPHTHTTHTHKTLSKKCISGRGGQVAARGMRRAVDAAARAVWMCGWEGAPCRCGGEWC